MGATDRFSLEDVQRIVGLTRKQLDDWDRLQLVSPRREQGAASYDFRDLIGLRTLKQLLEKGVSPKRLQQALSALNDKLSQVHTPLSQLRILSDGKEVVVEHGGARLEPISGQFVLNFETRELEESVRVIAGRPGADWFAQALALEADRKTRAQAIEAYDRCLASEPQNVDALLNCGTIHYEDGRLAQAADYFRRAVVAAPQNSLAHFNLGSVLDEMRQLEQARAHLREAVQLDPHNADAHYNLAFVCEKLRSFAEACDHWQMYVKLDPAGSWSNYARQRLAAARFVRPHRSK